jgi:hypothetical protein
MSLCLYVWFNKQVPKDFAGLMTQHITAAHNMLHCFRLLSAESAGIITFKQPHDIQVLSYSSMFCEDHNCHLKLMPA